MASTLRPKLISWCASLATRWKWHHRSSPRRAKTLTRKKFMETQKRRCFGWPKQRLFCVSMNFFLVRVFALLGDERWCHFHLVANDAHHEMSFGLRVEAMELPQ